MGKEQAGAIARAILEPDLQAQEALQSKRAAEAADLAHKRRVAWISLLCMAAGAAIAYLTHRRVVGGVLFGAMGGFVVSLLLPRKTAV